MVKLLGQRSKINRLEFIRNILLKNITQKIDTDKGISGSKIAYPIRGILLDAARQTERFDYYARLIPDLARWGYNTILLHLFDDDGAAIQLQGPRLLTTPGALSVEQWQSLTRLAADYGIIVIPELECLGHAGYITRLPENADLREPPCEKGVYWSINPFQPRTLTILSNVMSQLAAIFPAPYLHIGMDEADLGGSQQSQTALQEKPLWRIFGDYVLQMHTMAKTFGRECLIWGDHVLKHPEMRDLLPKDIIICNWLYGKNHSEDYAHSLHYFLEAGFRTLACPSGNCWALFAPESEHLANVRKFSETCRTTPHEKLVGEINTIWETYTLLPACVHPVMAYGGQVFTGGNTTPESFFTQFAAEQFGLSGPALAQTAEGLRLLHMERQRNFLERDMASGKLKVLQKRKEELERYRALCMRAEAALYGSKTAVTRRADEFEQWHFTALFLTSLSALCLQELDRNRIDRVGRQRLLDEFQTVALRYRDSLGTEAEEPPLDQIPRYWQESDNPVRLLGLKAAGATPQTSPDST